jgi:hypothetical protein
VQCSSEEQLSSYSPAQEGAGLPVVGIKAMNYRIIFSAMIFSKKSSGLVCFLKFRFVDCSDMLLF